MAATLAAAQIVASLLVGQPMVGDALLRDAVSRLSALANGQCGVPEFDALRLVDDWERGPRGMRSGHLERN